MLGKSERIIVMSLITFFLFIQLIPANVESVGPPKVYILMNEGEEIQEADVTPGQHGLVTFNCKVISEPQPGGNVQKYIVSITAISEQGWSTSVNPLQIAIKPGEEAPFQVDVTVPTQTSCEIIDEISISGKAVAYPGAMQTVLEPINGQVRVIQFCQLSVSSPNPDIKTSLNQRKAFNLRIMNTGNGRDTFSIEILNLDDLDRKGFTVTLSQEMIDIESHEEATIQVAVTTPASSGAIGKHEIELEVGSEGNNDGTTAKKYFALTMEIPGENILITYEFLISIIILIAIIVCVGYLLWKRKKKKSTGKI